MGVNVEHNEHAAIIAAVALGNNGWVYRFALTAAQRTQADAAVEAGALCKVWRLLSGHPSQQAYALPKVLERGGA